MKTITAFLDPQAARARVAGKGATGKSTRDAGFSLIEIMAGMAIIAILALAILPQFSKYFERAAVQNLSSEMTNAALLAESDFSLTGSTLYDQTKVAASLNSSNKSPGTTFSAILVNTTDSLSYSFLGNSTSVKNYCLKYNSGGTTPGLAITKKASPTTVCS